MNFLAPERLLLIVPVVALAAAYVVLLRRRKKYAVRFTNVDLLDSVAPKRPGWRRHTAAGLAGLSALALVVGLARPTGDVTVATEDAIVLLAIDTSLSMGATDVAPSRMAVAIDEATAFVDELPEGVRVGLVAFDGSVRVLSTPTRDHDQVTAAIGGLSTGPGTAGGDAIETALRTIEMAFDDESPVDALAGSPAVDPADDPDDESADTAEPAATIVMLSDGTTTVGTDILDAASSAADAGVPVSTITYGTESGVVTVDGQTVPVPPDRDTMSQVAEATDGEAFEAATVDELRAVYDDLEARVGTTTEQRELTLAFVAGAFVALMVAAGASFAWTGRFL